MVRRDIWLRTFTLVAIESGIIVAAVMLSLYWRYPDKYEELLWSEGQRGFAKLLLTAAVGQLTFYLFDLYDLEIIHSLRELCRRILMALATSSFILALIFWVIPTVQLGYIDTEDPTEAVGGVPSRTIVITLFLMIGWRILSHWVLSHPRFGERVLIVGTDTSAIELAQAIINNRNFGYRIVGFVSEDPAQVGQSLVNPKVIGVVSELNSIVTSERVDRVVVALSDRRGHLPVDQLLKLRLQGRAVIEEGTSLYERIMGKISVDMLRPSWIIFSGGTKRRRLWSVAHRLFNFSLAVVGIGLSFPLWVLTAIAIKLESPGPAFYKQERVGKNGKLFTIIKFRSMRQDAEKDGPVWASKDDDRTTYVGKFIRKVRIDELPQLINVLRGEMSFVGPRPERPMFVEQLTEVIPFYSQRHLVEPGLTGWAQVKYDYGASVEDALQKLQYDLYYIKNVSLFFDIWIILQTIKIVLFGRGR
jgi:sugar transferase (PEP-CTERM system associated)